MGGYQPQYVQPQNQNQENTFTAPVKHHRKWPWILVIVVFVSYLAAITFWPAPTVKATTSIAVVPPQQVSLPFPAYGTSAVGVKGGGVLASSTNQKSAPVASTAKMMTALSVLKQKPLKPGEEGPMLTIDQADVDYYNRMVYEGGSTVPVKLGQQISEQKALEMLLIPSANNIAYALARWAFGSIENYQKYANDYAKQLGAKNSNFTDPSGYDPTTVSTASDLVIIGEELMSSPVLTDIVAKQRVDLGGGSSLPSTNSFLVLKPDVIGIKTGNSDQANGCYVVAVKSSAPNGQPLTIISAVTNAPSLIKAMDDAYALAKTTASQISMRIAAENTQKVGTYSAPWKATADAIVQDDLSVLAWQGSSLKPQASLTALHPSTGGTTAGKVIVGSVTGSDAATPAVLATALDGPSWLWRLTHPITLFRG